MLFMAFRTPSQGTVRNWKLCGRMFSTSAIQTEFGSPHPCSLLARRAPDRSDAHMLAHMTLLEAPTIWLVFTAGIIIGAATTYFLMQRTLKRS